MMHLSLRSACLASVLAFAACGGKSAKPATGPAPMGDTKMAEPAATAKLDIVDTASGAGTFTTLLTAVKAADLETTLRGPGPFTVFAPTDEAFAKLPAGTVESLLKPENKAKLTAILTYHVVAGKVDAASAMKLTSAKTVNGKDVKIQAMGTMLHVGGAMVTTADIEATNGVIHVIDTVLIPE